jgi:hypothetical protein
MKDTKTVAVSVAIPIIMALAVVALVVVPWDDLFAPKIERDPYLQSNEYLLTQQKYQIRAQTGHAGTGLRDSITLQERMGSDGKPYYIGVLSDELDKTLDELVAAYNADPTTTAYIDITDVRYDLTENIRIATDDPSHKSAFSQFLLWCKQSADLVYSGTVTDGNGTQHKAGDDAPSSTISNYDFVVGKGEYPNYIYRHKYEAGK